MATELEISSPCPQWIFGRNSFIARMKVVVFDSSQFPFYDPDAALA
jgi:hypothetical protein